MRKNVYAQREIERNSRKGSKMVKNLCILNNCYNSHESTMDDFRFEKSPNINKNDLYVATKDNDERNQEPQD